MNHFSYKHECQSLIPNLYIKIISMVVQIYNSIAGKMEKVDFWLSLVGQDTVPLES